MFFLKCPLKFLSIPILKYPLFINKFNSSENPVFYLATLYNFHKYMSSLPLSPWVG